MCGIIGIIGQFTEQEVVAFQQRRDRLMHRGPDDAGEWVDRKLGVALGHRRLSILDTTEASHQPYVLEGGRLVLVFNGEIYNYLELREELIAHGYRFGTSGDTEVLLRAYQQWGTDCLERLNGMWAFVLLDRRSGPGRERLFLARDRVGKKPLYYAHQGRRLNFASELKGVPHDGRWNLRALNQYLARGYVPFDQCLFEGVRKLPPAHAALYDINRGQLRTWRYWHLPKASQQSSVNTVINGDRLADEAWAILQDSVRLRLRSHVPTGVFLSGGVDSSLVTAAAATVSSALVKTFTVALPGSPLDESAHAQRVAAAFGTDHHVLELPAPSLNVLDDLAAFIDEPIADSSILPTLLVSRLTAQHVRVALGGDGGDELYGGYGHYQRALRDVHHLGRLPRSMFKAAGWLAAQLPAGVRGRNRVASLRGGPREVSVWGTPYFDIDLRRRLLSKDVLAELGDDLAEPERDQLTLLNASPNLLDAMTRADFQRVLPDDYLVKVDRASMVNSLEVRAPWLDVRLVEHAFSKIPPQWKCSLTERRQVQNLMARRYLPKEFKLNRKQGFSVPMDAWLREVDLTSYMAGLPGEIFNAKQFDTLVTGQSKGRTNGSRLFGLMMLMLAGH